MTQLLKFTREYYLVAAVVVVIALAGLFNAVGWRIGANWLLAIFSLMLAIKLAWGMVQTLREGSYGIDLLAVTAIVSTVAVGEYWAAIVIVLMLTGGEALEDYASARAQRELTALLARAPQIAHKLDKKGNTTDVAITDIKIGDNLLVRPGETVPVDATLTKGMASFDESSLTGESLPVDHTAGDELLSGSINGDQAVTITALRTAHDSQYQKIIELVKAASSTEAPFVRLADRYAVPFTLVSFAIAGVAWVLAGNPLRFAQVLVVATPCPLLIGAPVALISGMSRQAKHGIIVKSGAILEKLARIKTVAFDKTGTLTRGQPQVASVLPVKGINKKDLVHLAASAEQQSAHILAQALVAEATSQKITLAKASNVREITAGGVQAKVSGATILVGKASYLESQGVKVAQAHASSGTTAVYVARDKTYIGAIQFADAVRDNSRETLQKLGELGIAHTLMVTGDAKATAARIAKELGITDVKAELLPADKVKAIADVTDRPVLMVGDGVNDAPVLAAADVGMAMGAKGATAASESADVVVLLDDISRVARAIAIANDTMRIALQSIWVGIAISVGLMIVAATGIIPAVIGAGLQEIVDVVVIINALRAHGSWRVVKG
ncbi:MAG TPA: heavy metal translocating P-type ATPase [Candidatus Saccharimonas sp.]|nr:heavy metal translocating P-type ATPase [Candidatus Saccharimonas sp.]